MVEQPHSTDENEPKVEANKQTVFKEEAATETSDSKKTTMVGLEENVAGLLSYVVIVGIVFLFIEKENQFIRFHALQAIFLAIFLTGIYIFLGFIPILGLFVSLFIMPLSFILWVFLMYQAYSGKMFKLPVIGDLAKKHSIPE